MLNGSTVNYVMLSVGGLNAVPSFNSGCPGGAAALDLSTPLAAAAINVTAFYNISSDLLVPYGPDGTYVNVSAGSVKFNIDAAGWPFCSAANQLMVELSIFTSSSAADSDEPVLFDDAESSDGGHAWAACVGCMRAWAVWVGFCGGRKFYL
jgi:hypothetical protein